MGVININNKVFECLTHEGVRFGVIAMEHHPLGCWRMLKFISKPSVCRAKKAYFIFP